MADAAAGSLDATVAAIMALAYRCTHDSSTAGDIDALAAAIRAALVSAEQGARERAIDDGIRRCESAGLNFAAKELRALKEQR